MTVNNMKNHAPESVSHTSLMPIKMDPQTGNVIKGDEWTFWRTQFASRMVVFFPRCCMKLQHLFVLSCKM